MFKYTNWFIGNLVTVKFNFKNGVLNGPFTITEIDKKGKIVESISCNFSNGVMVGKATGKNLRLAVIGDMSSIKTSTFTGQYDNDGFPIGKWKLIGKSREIIENYIAGDTCIFKYNNLATGDRIKPQYAEYCSPILPNLIIKEIMNLSNVIFLRDTPKVSLTPFEYQYSTIGKTAADPSGKHLYSITFLERDYDSDVFVISYPHRHLTNIEFQNLESIQFQSYPDLKKLHLNREKRSSGGEIPDSIKNAHSPRKNFNKTSAVPYDDQKLDKKPEFPGGDLALMKWLASNISYPEAALQDGVQGRVVVRFTIEKDGSVAHACILKGEDKDLAREALRVVKLMPKWKPGILDGEPVEVVYAMPITFK